MTNSISAINGSSSVSSTSSSSSKPLSEETRKKLEALGIDTTNIKTESEGQTKLKEAQSAQANAQAGGQKPPQGALSPEKIKEEVEALASKVGVSVGNSDKIEDIMNNISKKISEIKASAKTDPNKLAEAESFESEYTTLSSELSQMKAAQNMTGASALANYNKLMLVL